MRMARVSNVFGLVFVIVFGIVWTMIALSIPSSIGNLFAIIGVMFVAYSVVQLFYSLRRGSVQSPPAAKAPEMGDMRQPDSPSGNGFCPHCGSPVGDSYEYCRVCGRRIS